MNDLTITDAATATNKDRRTIRRWLDSGRFPGAYRLNGGDWRIPVADLLAAGLELEAPAKADEVADEVADLVRKLTAAESRATLAEALLAERGLALDDARLALRALSAAAPVEGRKKRWFRRGGNPPLA